MVDQENQPGQLFELRLDARRQAFAKIAVEDRDVVEQAMALKGNRVEIQRIPSSAGDDAWGSVKAVRRRMLSVSKSSGVNA